MKLTYRGITYDRNPSEVIVPHPFQSLRPSVTPYNLIYRGVTYTVNPSVQQTKFPTKRANYKLSYRGLTYLVN
jgi:hypothetical protein